MTPIKWLKRARALVIVAHPDDETIWLGGLIAKMKDWHWTIFSLCRADDPDRAPKFFRVCRHFGAQGLISDWDDEGKLDLEESVPLAREIIEKKIGRKKYDYIFSHGLNGEYGHPCHIGAHLAITGLIKDKFLQSDMVFYFNYKKTGRYPNFKLKLAPNTDIVVKLTPAEYAAKRKIMTDVYGFAPDGIDTGYCTNPEGFKMPNVK